MSLLAADPLLAALLGAIAIATVLAALALGVLALAGRCRAAARECVAFAAVLALLLTPSVHLAGHQLGFGIALLPSARATAPPQQLAPTSSVSVPLGAATTVAPVAAVAGPEQAAAPATALPTPFAWPAAGALLLAAWLVFAATRLGLDLWCAVRLARRVRRLPRAEPALQLMLADAAQALGLAQAPQLHAGVEVVCPATIGILRPRMVAPRDLLAQHGRAATAAMLRHECAHLACGHHRQGIAVLLLRALFGWHPLASALLRALASAQEDVADNAAAASGDAAAYARSLLALAERAGVVPARPLQLSALGRSPLAARIRRLLAKETEPMLQPEPSMRVLTTVGAAFLLTATAAVRFTPAQDPSLRKEHPGSAVGYLPLRQGSAWTWRLTQKSDDGETTIEEVAWDFGEVPSAAGPCHQLLVTRSDHADTTPQYWSVDATGIYEHECRYTANIRGPGSSRTRLVPAPLGVETSWSWSYQLSYQTMGQVERDPEQDRVSCTGELVALTEPVKVPAGEFVAARIKITETCAWWPGPSIRELWFAPGTGLVKSIDRGPSGEHVRELTSHAPAAAVAAVDDDAAVLAALQGDPRAANGKPAIAWLGLEDAACYLRGRVALVTLAGADATVRTAFYCADGKIAEIAADAVPFWALRWDEALRGPAVRARAETPAGPARQISRGAGMEVTFLAQVYGAVEAHRQGCTELQSIGSNTTTQLDTGETTHTSLWHCRDAALAEKDLEATFAVSDKTITAASARLATSTRADGGQRKTLTPGVPLPRGR